MKLKKRILYLLISIMILFTDFGISYNSVYAFDIPTAFWGTLEASRAFWTAMNTGGALENGVSISKFEHSYREDVQSFQTQVLIAYAAFCIYKEKLKLKLDHPTWSDEEVNEEAERLGNQDAENFKKNAINVSTTTGNLTLKDYGYWREFCKELAYISQNGLGSGGDIIGNDTVIHGTITTDISGANFSVMSNLGANTFVYDDKYYIKKGTFYRYLSSWQEQVLDITNVPTDRVRIPFVEIFPNKTNKFDYEVWWVDVNRLTGDVITTFKYFTSSIDYGDSTFSSSVQRFLDHTSFPCIITGKTDQAKVEYIDSQIENYKDTLSITGASGAAVEDYQYLLEDAIDSTEIGKAIEEGGEDKSDIVKEGSVPIKRSSVKVGEETATGVIGWDIPDTNTLEGAIAQPQEKGREEAAATGIISVPISDTETATDSTTITWSKDVPISVPLDEDESATLTIDDVISIQGGDFYPTAFDITGFFPFCIPFDIYYCVQKFNVGNGSAPILHLPIVYPNVLKPMLGDSYDVVIDFNNYIALRNIIRGFILLFFIIGLAQVTRTLIRG